MTDPEVEDLLRETFREREAHARPLSRVRPKPRRPAYVAAGVATLAVLAGAIVAANALRSPPPPTVDIPAAAASDSPSDGWRWESSLGAEIQVPENWTVNEYGCGSMTANPTVVRGVGAQTACAPAVPAGKEVALLTTAATPDEQLKLTSAPTAVDGVPAVRAVGRLNDGRYAGSIVVASKDVGVVVFTKSEGVTARILDSFRLVDVDHLGCSAATTISPADLKPASGPPAVPPASPDLVICLYGDGPRLQSSTKVTGAAAGEILAAVRAAEEGQNPDPPASQCISGPAESPDLVLLPEGGVPLTVVFSPCIGRGVTDGQHWSHLSSALLAKLMGPLHAGYGLSAPLD
jgi:hypothetical protein